MEKLSVGRLKRKTLFKMFLTVFLLQVFTVWRSDSFFYLHTVSRTFIKLEMFLVAENIIVSAMSCIIVTGLACIAYYKILQPVWRQITDLKSSSGNHYAEAMQKQMAKLYWLATNIFCGSLDFSYHWICNSTNIS